MSITHVASSSDSGSANTSSTTVSKPTGIQVGDLLVAFVVMNDDTSATGPSGWTKYDDDVDAGDHFRSQVWYCVATSTQTGASNFTWNDPQGANSPMWGAISAYRGVDTGGVPIHAAAQSSFTTDGNTAVTGPSVTTTKATRVLHFRCTRLSGGTTIFTYTGSAGTRRWQAGNHGASTAYAGTLFDLDVDDSAGTVSGITITSSGSPSTSFSRTLALPVLITDVSVNMPTPPDSTATAYGAQVLTGIAAQAVTATASAAAYDIKPGVQGNVTPTCQAYNATVSLHSFPMAETAQAVADAGTNGVHYGAPPSRTMIVGRESRSWLPPAENRVYTVERRDDE